MTTRPQLVLWGFEADWELAERTPGAVSEPALGRSAYVDLLAALVAGSPSNRALLQRFVQQRIALGGRCPDDDDGDAFVELMAEALARGMFELRAIPRPNRGRWTPRSADFDEPAVPLHTLIRDPVPAPEDSSFVAFIVVDQDFHPLAGRFVCTIDADDRRGDFSGAASAKPVRYEPIRVRARVEVDVTQVRVTGEASADD